MKLHGDINHPEDIVLARRDFSRFGADNSPAGALLQSAMMTRHLFVVGASMKDANILRLAHEVIHFRRAHDLAEEIGTVITLKPDPGQERLWEGELAWISAGTEDMSDEEAGRSLELFLDDLSMWAATEGPYLLDPRYAALLSPEERGLAKTLLDALPELERQQSAHKRSWKAISTILRNFGAS